MVLISETLWRHGSTIYSGLEYQKVAVFLTALNMKPVNRNLHYKVQGHYAIPAVDAVWKKKKKEILDKCRNRPVAVGGTYFFFICIG